MAYGEPTAPRAGLVSVTFRALPPDRVASLAAAAGLAGIEWGGDVHVPHGDLAAARRVRRWTVDAGLAVASYGSYWRAGDAAPGEGPDPDAVLSTAEALGAPHVRVWAGRQGSADCPEDLRRRIAEDLAAFAASAADRGLAVSLEYHGGTLTDTAASALRLLDEAGAPGLRLYWQPLGGRTPDERAADLARVAPRLSNLHVYQWAGDERRPLAEGGAEWTRYLRIARGTGAPGWALLEFVRGDDPARLAEDAAALRSWLETEG